MVMSVSVPSDSSNLGMKPTPSCKSETKTPGIYGVSLLYGIGIEPNPSPKSPKCVTVSALAWEDTTASPARLNRREKQMGQARRANFEYTFFSGDGNDAVMMDFRLSHPETQARSEHGDCNEKLVDSQISGFSHFSRVVSLFNPIPEGRLYAMRRSETASPSGSG